MDWLKRMNSALNYIEDSLTEDIDMAEVSKRACCSNFNFQRMFSFVAGVPLAEYIRKRRLSVAAMDILSTNEKVIDVAMKYGYESPVSFTRAFFAVHGINPSEVKKTGSKIKSYPRISFEITIKGVEAMNYRIEEIGEFRLVGYKEKMHMDNGENFRRIPEFWNEVCESGKYKKMLQYNDNEKLCCIGACANGNDKEFDYYITTGSNKEIPDDMVELIVPVSTYAIFECIGKMPEGQQNMTKRIFSEWFSTSNFELLDGPQIEWYSNGDMSSDEYLSEIWMPVRKKN